jgi:hypothetical protein
MLVGNRKPVYSPTKINLYLEGMIKIHFFPLLFRLMTDEGILQIIYGHPATIAFNINAA